MIEGWGDTAVKAIDGAKAIRDTEQRKYLSRYRLLSCSLALNKENKDGRSNTQFRKGFI